MKKTRNSDRTLVPANRVNAIATRAAPDEYATVGRSGGRSSRQTVYKLGVITLPHGDRIPVAIKNLSATGCRVEYFQKAHLEGRVLVSEPSIPLSRRAEVIWREEGATGLRFIDEEISGHG